MSLCLVMVLKFCMTSKLSCRKKYQRFLVARVAIEPSEPLSLENVVVQRLASQSSFMPAKSFDDIIGNSHP